MNATLPVVTLNGLPAPALRPLTERGLVVAVIDQAGRLFLPVGGTGIPSDLGPLFSAAKNPPREIATCDGMQFFPASWISSSGLIDAPEMAQRVAAVAALAGAPIA